MLTSSGFADALRIPLSEARDLVGGLGIELEKLANQLPGNSSEYSELFRLISDDILRAKQDLEGANFTYGGFEDTIKTIIPRLSILANQAGVTAGNASLALTRALGGSASWAELRRLDIFEKNPLFRNAIQEQLVILGKDINDLTEGQILQVLERASIEALPDSYLDAARQTVDAKLQNFLGAWFGELTGVFSIRRDLDPKISGSQSVFTSMGQTLADFFYVLQSLGQIFSTLTGIEDPMKALDNAIRAFDREFLAPLARVLASLAKVKSQAKLTSILGSLGSNLFQDLSDSVKSGVDKWTQILPEKINEFYSFLIDVDWTGMGAKVGEFLAEYFNKLVLIVGKIDFSLVVVALWEVLKGVIWGLTAFLANVDYGLLLGAIGDMLIDVVHGLLIALGDLINLTGVMIGNNFSGLGSMISSSFNWIESQIPDWLVNPLRDMLLGLGENFRNIFDFMTDRQWNMLTIFKEGVNKLEAAIKENFRAMVEALGRTIDFLLPGDQSSLYQTNKDTVNNQRRVDILNPTRDRRPFVNPQSASSGADSIYDMKGILPGARGSTQGGLTVQSLTINAGATADPERLAKETVRYMAREYETYKSSVQATGSR